MKGMENKCIRVFADEKQINRCKEEVSELETSFYEISKGLSLAGNNVRLKILYLLNKENKMCPCDLSDILNMTVPAISQHLKKMKEALLIKDNKIGQTVFYSIEQNQMSLLEPIFNMVEYPDKITT